MNFGIYVSNKKEFLSVQLGIAIFFTEQERRANKPNSNMCGGGMGPLPLWLAIPLIGGAIVVNAAEKTVSGVAAASGAAYTAGKLASNEAGKQLDHFLHPDVLANAIAADPANPRLYLQRAQTTFAALSAPSYRSRPTGGMRGMRGALRGQIRRGAASRYLGGGGGQLVEEDALLEEEENKARKVVEQAEMEEVVRDAQQSVGLSGGRGSVASVEALYVLGLALDRLGRWAEAAEAFAHAIDALQAKTDNEVEGNSKDDEAEEEEEPSEEEPLQRAHGGKHSPAATVGHKYAVQTFRLKPTFCDHCSKLLVGFRNQGPPPLIFPRITRHLTCVLCGVCRVCRVPCLCRLRVCGVPVNDTHELPPALS
jgi:hypothetical protein